MAATTTATTTATGHETREQGRAMESSPEHAESTLARAREGLSELDRRTRAFIGERPLVALACAIGIGYAVGRLVARR